MYENLANKNWFWPWYQLPQVPFPPNVMQHCQYTWCFVQLQKLADSNLLHRVCTDILQCANFAHYNLSECSWKTSHLLFHIPILKINYTSALKLTWHASSPGWFPGPAYAVSIFDQGRCVPTFPGTSCQRFRTLLVLSLSHELKNKNMPYHVFQLSLEQVVRYSGVRTLLIKSRGQLKHKVKIKVCHGCFRNMIIMTFK